ncbi:hypothetical protein EJ05DRAFT_475012 [Pseudovirgaria hyperparasitica]|uniref:Helicase C-terminal domain-containing protein n=1 Tax=Pseudovirgaria hyperparasitica TaxID=470096 RepID=A0A6A6WDE8_9PEZI|nr:uncharacterized protein EJ05DRAFT_475012 [Pseudovirgaria hyperparasitica]KAF2759990.1 hypothetical protein EJ05DRAFT_475012 [Pseudovirgaria hyperparasitica]
MLSSNRPRKFVGVVIYNDPVSRVQGQTTLPKRPRRDTNEGLCELRQEPGPSGVKRRRIFSHVEIFKKPNTTYDVEAVIEIPRHANTSRRNKPRVSYKEVEFLSASDSEDDFKFEVSSDEQSNFAADTDSQPDTDISSASETEPEYTDESEIQHDDEPVPKSQQRKLPAKQKSIKYGVSEGSFKAISEAKQLPLPTLGRQSSKGLDPTLPPLSKIDDIFIDITDKALTLGLSDVLKFLGGRPLRVATMCSGTEAPMLALNLISRSLPMSEEMLNIEHAFSAEFVPFKQAYIYRNFAPDVLFRDIREFENDMDKAGATTVWGSKKTPPGNVDLLVAGFSCKDRSPLNMHRKEVGKKGETTDTLKGTIAYAREKRPRIVVLENVKGIEDDWPKIQKYWEDIDYAVMKLNVDTKNYYIPATRQRVYILCLDKKASKVDTKEPLHKWEDLMLQFRRPASSSMEAFMLPDDDPRARHVQKGDPSRETDWTRCRERHLNMRARYRLGERRPFTEGYQLQKPRVPDFSNHAWHTRQAKRVLDLLDISHLRNARPERGGYDSWYKLRCWNPSQNVDHASGADTQAFGIAPCLTPRTIPYNSCRGSMISGLEALALQGIPIDDLLTIETDSELADLAGNAMTTTVVGPAILSALIVALPHMRLSSGSPGPPKDTARITKPEPRTVATQRIVQASSGPKSEHLLTTQKLLGEAIASSRRCSCEKQGETKSYVRECSSCGYTACTDCLGNPQHVYIERTYLVKSSRSSPMEFVAEWKPRLPLCLNFDGVGNCTSMLKHMTLSTKEHKDRYLTLLQGLYEQDFVLGPFRRSDGHWTVMYESSNGYLKLILGSKPKWLLYLKCPSDLPVNSELRATISQPVARSEGFISVFGDGWSQFVPCRKKISFTVTASSSTSPSWRAVLGFPDFENETVPTRLTIKTSKDAHGLDESLDGEYRHLPECGTASQMLYQRTGTDPLYLFLDPSKTGNPDEDTMVFSYEHRRLMVDETRVTIARLDPKFRPWDFAQGPSTRTITGESNGNWSANDVLSLHPKQTKANALIPSSLRQWLDSCDVDTCGQLTTILCCEFRIDTSTQNELSQCRSPASAQDLLLSRFISFAQHWQSHVKLSEWQSMDVNDKVCGKCEPTRPPVTWAVDKKGNSTVRWIELAEPAAVYERAVSQRPLAHSLQAEVRQGQSGGSGRIGVACDVVTLLHRAMARFNGKNGSESAQCRLLTKPQLGTIYKRERFILKDNSGDRTYSVELANGYKLFKNQQRSLHWMRQRELHQSCIVVEEVEEDVIPRLEWRMEVKATRKVGVRGGCLADTVSYGKTLLSLSLIHAEFLDKSMRDLEQENEKIAGDLINVPASLVICQQSLTTQWENEINKFLPKEAYKGTVLVIRKFGDLQKLNVENIRKAKIIILSWSVLADKSYIENLGSFVGMPTVEADSKYSYGRLYTLWIQCCAERIPKCLNNLRAEGLAKFSESEPQRLEENLSRPEFAGVLPDKYYTGQRYVKEAEKQRLVAERDAKVRKSGPSKQKSKKLAYNASDSWKDLQGPPMHIFSFNRIIVDEFSYLEEGTSQDKSHPVLYPSIKSLTAPKRWILSGTPALDDFIDVKRMAALIGVDLGINDYTPGVVTKRNLEASRKSQTVLEQFETYRKAKSVDWHQHRDAGAQQFLDQCVRRNAADLRSISWSERLVTTIPLSGQRILYDEAAAHLSIPNIKRTSPASDPSDRASSIRMFWQESDTFEEALVRASNESTPLRDIEEIISTRAAEKNQMSENLDKLLSQVKGLPVSLRDDRYYSGWLREADKNHDLKARFDAVVAGPKQSFGTEGLKNLFDKVRTTTYKLQVMENALNYAKQVRRFEARGPPRCATCTKSATVVLPLCGHAVCETCYEHAAARSECVDGCEALSTFATRDLDFSRAETKMTGLIKVIKGIPKDDQALIFAPGSESVKNIRKVLREHNVSCFAIVSSEERAVEDLEEFKADRDPSTKRKVLVLNVGDETAAGSNLTNANHIIFIAPLLSRTQEHYNQAMEQAIGRARRYGQKKEVQIYRFVALGTIEADILQLRERRNCALRQRPDEEEVEAITVQANDGKKEPTLFVRSEQGEIALVPASWANRKEDFSKRLPGFNCKSPSTGADLRLGSGGQHVFAEHYLA